MCPAPLSIRGCAHESFLFQIAHKLITGAGAIEQLAAELTRLDVDNPLIVTDAALVKSGTVELALALAQLPAMAVEAVGIERLMRNNPRKLSAVDIEKIYRAPY